MPDDSIVLPAMACVFAVYYLFTYLNNPPSMARTLFKTLPVLLLAVASMLAGLPGYLTFALLLSAAGDAALSRSGKKAFLIGLGCFLLAHIFYIFLFLEYDNLHNRGKYGLLMVVALMALTIMVVHYVWPHIHDLKIPVVAYSLVITLMGIAAISLPAFMWLVMAGAALFILSDTVLAIETFVQKQPERTGWIVWCTYFTGQLLIFLGIWTIA